MSQHSRNGLTSCHNKAAPLFIVWELGVLSWVPVIRAVVFLRFYWVPLSREITIYPSCKAQVLVELSLDLSSLPTINSLLTVASVALLLSSSRSDQLFLSKLRLSLTQGEVSFNDSFLLCGSV